MKPNKKQRRICDVMRSQTEFWLNTNDISSPTHIVDIEEECYAVLSDILKDEEYSEVENMLKKLYWFIRKYD